MTSMRAAVPTRSARWRRTSRVSVATAALALAAVAIAPESSAQASFYYEVAAGASPVYVSIEREGYVLNPLLQANVLESKADANSTGTRHGFASLLNPGPVGGFPALIGLAVSGLPPIPYQGYPLSVDAYHPSEPEQHIGAGAVPVYDADRLDESAFGAGAVFAQAKAGEDRASGDGVGGELSFGGGAVRIGAVRSSTRIVDDGRTVRAVARTHLSNVEILDIVQIPAVEGRTEVVTSSSGSKTTSSITVDAVKALGADAVIDDKGIRITGLPGVPDVPSLSLDALNKELAERLSLEGVAIRLLPGGTAQAPADSLSRATAVAAALEVSYTLTISEDVPIPNIPGVPLGVPAGGGIPTMTTVSLARTTGIGVSGALGDLSDADSLAGDLDLGAGSDAGGSDFAGDAGAIGPFSDGALGADGLNLGAGGVPIGDPASDGSGAPAGVPRAGSGGVAAPVVGIDGRRVATLEGSFGWIVALGVAAAAAVVSQTRRRIGVLRAVGLREWIESSRGGRRSETW